MRGIGTFWNGNIRVRVEWEHTGMCGMGTFGYVWNRNIRVCMEWEQSGMYGMGTFGYA